MADFSQLARPELCTQVAFIRNNALHFSKLKEFVVPLHAFYNAVCFGLGHFGYRQTIHNFGGGIAGFRRRIYFQDGDWIFVFVYFYLKIDLYHVFYEVVTESRVLILSVILAGRYMLYSLLDLLC